MRLLFFPLLILFFDFTFGNRSYFSFKPENIVNKISIESALWIPQSICERIPEIPCNSSFNGIQKVLKNNCAKDSGDTTCEKYIPCKVKKCYLKPDWSSWGPWNCDNCFSDTKLAERKRICENLYEGESCIIDKRGVGNFEKIDCDEVCFKGLTIFVLFS